MDRDLSHGCMRELLVFSHASAGVFCVRLHTTYMVHKYVHTCGCVTNACACRLREAHTVGPENWLAIGQARCVHSAIVRSCALTLVDLKYDDDAGSTRIRIILLCVSSSTRRTLFVIGINPFQTH